MSHGANPLVYITRYISERAQPRRLQRRDQVLPESWHEVSPLLPPAPEIRRLGDVPARAPSRPLFRLEPLDDLDALLRSHAWPAAGPRRP